MRVLALIFLVIIILSGIAGPIFVDDATYQNTIAQEIEDAKEWYGPDASLPIIDRTKSTYLATKNLIKVDSLLTKLDGLKKGVKRITSKRPDPWEIKESTASMGGGRNIDTEAYSILLLSWRLNNASLWVGYLIPIMLALFFDAIMRRNARLASVDYASPSWYSTLWITNISAMGILAAILVSPITLPIEFYPVAFLGIGLLWHQLLTSIQPSA